MENQPTTNPSNIPSTDLLPVSSQRKTNVIVPILITLLVSLVLFGLGGYYVGKQSAAIPNVVENVETSPIPTSSATPSNSPSAAMIDLDATADWETYSSPEYSFKHPKGLESDRDAAGAGAESIRVKLMGPKQIASGRTQTSLFDGYFFVVTKIGSITEKSVAEWAAERKSNSEGSCGPEGTVSADKTIALENASGVQYTVKNCMGDYTLSYLSNGTSVYEVTQLYTGEPADQKVYQEITNQIFNTLRFL